MLPGVAILAYVVSSDERTMPKGPGPSRDAWGPTDGLDAPVQRRTVRWGRVVGANGRIPIPSIPLVLFLQKHVPTGYRR